MDAPGPASLGPGRGSTKVLAVVRFAGICAGPRAPTAMADGDEAEAKVRYLEGSSRAIERADLETGG